jgi:hypothetical protein
MSLKRKLKREAHKNSKKDFSKKVGLFNKIPDLCLTCNKVVVNRQKEEVRLYCPECWNKAKSLIDEIKDGYTNSKTNV